MCDPIANPRNIEEIAILNSLRQTLRGDNILLYDSGVEDADRKDIWLFAISIGNIYREYG